jgi:hypothetical protein
MERVVGSNLLAKIEAVNAQIAPLLANARLALSGERLFGVAEVRALSAPVTEMAPIMARAAELRGQHPELIYPLEQYKSQLRELRAALEQIRVMLLARRGQMDAGRVQLDAVTHWAKALSRTR